MSKRNEEERGGGKSNTEALVVIDARYDLVNTKLYLTRCAAPRLARRSLKTIAHDSAVLAVDTMLLQTKVNETERRARERGGPRISRGAQSNQYAA